MRNNGHQSSQSAIFFMRAEPASHLCVSIKVVLTGYCWSNYSTWNGQNPLGHDLRPCTDEYPPRTKPVFFRSQQLPRLVAQWICYRRRSTLILHIRIFSDVVYSDRLESTTLYELSAGDDYAKPSVTRESRIQSPNSNRICYGSIHTASKLSGHLYPGGME